MSATEQEEIYDAGYERGFGDGWMIGAMAGAFTTAVLAILWVQI